MIHFSYLGRIILGGAICGIFLGSFAGALAGIAYSLIAGEVGFGLDGALLGGGLGGIAGSLYGASIAFLEEPHRTGAGAAGKRLSGATHHRRFGLGTHCGLARQSAQLPHEADGPSNRNGRDEKAGTVQLCGRGRAGGLIGLNRS